MPLRKTREQREAERAEIDRKDREHAVSLAAVSAEARRPALLCQQCEAKLKPRPRRVTTAARRTWDQASHRARVSAR